MTNPHKSIAERLREAEVAINNSLASAEILTAVTPFGYDQPRLEAARTLYQEAQELTEKQAIEYGEQYEATAVVQRAWDEAALAYSAALKIARIVFRGNEAARNALGLSGTRKQSLSGWLKQAQGFYNNILRTPDFIAAMTPYTYNQAKLEAESTLVQAVSDASDVQDIERGQAQEATKIRDAKLDELDQWVADYKVIAEVALDASPQMLEQLGWVVPS
ncbi:MAG: hypothetical protein H6664_09650 [Ardenticatenaceae bacterium]|nr:hypothetical protein [Ardenticatenaceae bacterium]